MDDSVGVQHSQTLQDVRRSVRYIVRDPNHADVPRFKRCDRLRSDMLPAALIGNVFIRPLRLYQQAFQIAVNQVRTVHRLANMDHGGGRICTLLDAHIA